MSLILGTRNAMQECGVLNVCTLSPRDEWVYPNECYNVHRLLAYQIAPTPCSIPGATVNIKTKHALNVFMSRLVKEE